MAKHQMTNPSSPSRDASSIGTPPVSASNHVISILIFDSVSADNSRIASELRDAGYQIVGIATDPESLKDLSTKQRTNLIAIKAQNGTSDLEVGSLPESAGQLPSVVIADAADPEHIAWIRNRGASRGVYAYLVSPVSREQLSAAVDLSFALWQTHQQSLARIAQLEKSLLHRRTIEQAKWVLVQRKGLTEPQAHEQLQKAARNRRVPLVTVATEVIEQGSLS